MGSCLTRGPPRRIAGRDTTAQTLTWLFYLLSQYPAVGQQVLDSGWSAPMTILLII
jgi:cytochrome P450